MWKVVMQSASGAVTMMKMWALPWNTLSDSFHNFLELGLAFDEATLHWPHAGSSSLLKVSLIAPGLKWVMIQKKEGKMVLTASGLEVSTNFRGAACSALYRHPIRMHLRIVSNGFVF